MNKTIITIVIVIILMAGGGIFFANQQQKQAAEMKMQHDNAMMQKNQPTAMQPTPSDTMKKNDTAAMKNDSMKMDATGTPGAMKQEVTGMQQKPSGAMMEQK